jgi:ABC-type multidrug transport system fused ATPase/permease subunit
MNGKNSFRKSLNRTQVWINSSPVYRCFGVLSRTDQRKILAIAIVQIGMSTLDLLGVVAIGLLGALSVSGLQSQLPGNRVNSALEVLHLSEASFQKQAAVIGCLAVLFLVGRTLLSIFFTRRVLFFLSRRGAAVSANSITRLLSQSLLKMQTHTNQEILFAVTEGVRVITLQILATIVVLISDLSLLVIMAVGLFIVDPFTAIGTYLIFGFIGLLLYRLMHLRAGKLGQINSKLSIQSNEKIVEVLASYRESVVRNRRDYYAREIGKLRYKLADVFAETAFMPYVSKYVIETTVVVSALLIGAGQIILQDAEHAVATLAIFLAAGSRIAPAVLRVQQGLLTIKVGIGQAQPTLNLIHDLGNEPLVENVDDSLDVLHSGFNSEISIRGVTLNYPNKAQPAISDFSLVIPPGTSVAFVGPSGAGKTTIVDVILGVLNPDQGEVFISGLPPLFAVSKWPGAVSYVPQDVVIASGTIRENVALGYPLEVATDELVNKALKLAQLDKFVEDLPQGLDTQVGERGAKISGGQRQRLGIARAMFTQPHLLVLDEATSSLDGETEAQISDAIYSLRGSTTIVMIAHRLSTVRNADIVVYLSEGKVIAKGTFDELRNSIADFDLQARLMGL